MAAKKKIRRRRRGLVWNVTIPVNAAMVNSSGDRRVAKSHLVFKFEAYGPADAFRQMNTYLHDVLEDAQHHTRRVRLVSCKRKTSK